MSDRDMSIVDFSYAGIDRFADACEGSLDAISKAKFNPFWTLEGLLKSVPSQIQQAQASLKQLTDEREGLKEVMDLLDRAIPNAARAETVYKQRAAQERSRADEYRRARQRAANSSTSDNPVDLSSYDSAIEAAENSAEHYESMASQAYEDKCNYENRRYEAKDLDREFDSAQGDLNEFVHKAEGWMNDASSALEKAKGDCQHAENLIRRCVASAPEIKRAGGGIISSFKNAMGALGDGDAAPDNACQTEGADRFIPSAQALLRESAAGFSSLNEAGQDLSNALRDYESPLTFQAGKLIGEALDEIQEIERALNAGGQGAQAVSRAINGYLSISVGD